MTDLLGRDYWLIRSIPAAHTTDADVLAHVEEHLDWLLKLEADGVVFLSGPLTSGPDVRPGSGVTVLRAGSAEEARAIALGDPFVRAGLRTAEVYGWRVNEGAIRVQISLGTATYEWM
ncbi:YciI family protein [Dactylosporangium sp. CA-092794]|uniref:YciI family protein n=1 Tax=Dactylosporangium sp. CA-092794 TaxID=3239929 RepID=UPI003D92FC36